MSFTPRAWAVFIDPSNITASGSIYGGIDNLDHHPSATLDDDLDTAWHSPDMTYLGEMHYLAYKFAHLYEITQIDFTDVRPYPNSYNMGELDIQFSIDSTNGLDGTWRTLDHIAGDFENPTGFFTRHFNFELARWVRLWMTYEGRGAFNGLPPGVDGFGTPAFYLYEIDFYGPLIPEPSTILLFFSGLLGLAFKRS